MCKVDCVLLQADDIFDGNRKLRGDSRVDLEIAKKAKILALEVGKMLIL